ncbi:MAG: hypothetical protein KAU94_12615, partial [Verrucomicrobia bacterium]|nr:hypothetical protein [Verrucomicrobiota bacterium]
QIDEVWLFGSAISASTVALLYNNNIPFVLPATSLTIAGPISGNMELSWNGYAGVTYNVQTNSNLLSPANWNTLMTTTGTGSITVTAPTTEDQTFYRIIAE